MKNLFDQWCLGRGAAVCEGAMGLYDGVGGTDQASVWQVADALELPVLLVVEPIANIGEPERQLMERMKALGCPAVLAINKADTLEQKEKLLEVMELYSQACDFDAVVPISAKTGQGVEELLDVLDKYLPEGPQLFPDDMTSDQPERQMMAEILREKLLLFMGTKVYLQTWVKVKENWRDNPAAIQNFGYKQD